MFLVRNWVVCLFVIIELCDVVVRDESQKMGSLELLPVCIGDDLGEREHPFRVYHEPAQWALSRRDWLGHSGTHTTLPTLR